MQQTYPSYIHFGSPETFDKSGVVLNVHQDFFWSADWQGALFGENGAEFGFENGTDIYTIFDTNTIEIEIPDVYFRAFLTQLMNTAGVSASKYKLENNTVTT